MSSKEVICADCGAEMKLRDSKYGLFYGCTKYPECDGTHGAHPNGKPLGIPANKETKKARMKAHDSFDKLWKDWGWSRAKAYKWMRKAMKLSPAEAHIGKFTLEQCEKLIKLCEKR